jgi:hypothetical protein
LNDIGGISCQPFSQTDNTTPGHASLAWKTPVSSGELARGVVSTAESSHKFAPAVALDLVL